MMQSVIQAQQNRSVQNRRTEQISRERQPANPISMFTVPPIVPQVQ